MRWIAALIALLALAFVNGQEGMDMAPPKELRNVDFLLGKWSGTETFNMGGPPQKMTSTIVGSKVAGGRWYQGLHKSTAPKQPAFEGVHMLSYDSQKKKYVAYWFDNAASEAMYLDGDLTGNKMIMVSQPTPIPGSPEPVTFRATWIRNSATSMSFVLEMKQGPGWAKVIEGNYRKTG